MKKILAFALLLGTLSATPSLAQQTTTPAPTAQHARRGGGDRQPGQRVEKMTERLTKKLSLTADQTARVRTILTQSAETARANAEKATDRDGKRAAMQSAMNAADEQIAAILTPTQKEAFTKLRAEQREHRGEGRQRRQGNNGK